MSLRTPLQPQPVLDAPTRALIAAVEADPHAPLCVGIQAPGGYGKTVLLRALERSYRQAGVTVVDAWQDRTANPGPDSVVLVDDAHLLDEDRLRELARLAVPGGPRLAIGYRPWPRPPAMAELTELLRRTAPPLLLHPFTPDRTAAALRLLAGADVRPATVEFVHAQTAGIPRFVDRLARALLGTDGAGVPGQLPQSAILPFASDLDGLDDELRRLLLAAAADVDLPIDLLGALLSTEPARVDALLTAARATGLLGPDDRLPPIVKRAVAALSPATHRVAVWQRLAEFQLRRGGPVLPLARPLLGLGVAGAALAEIFEAAGDEALPVEPALAAELFAAAGAAGRPTAARRARATALAGDLDTALRLADRLIAVDHAPDRAEGASVAATALAHRGHLGRSAELYRWSGSASSAVFGAIGAAGAGDPATLTRVVADPPVDGPPTLLASAALLMARGVRETLSGAPTTALSALVQAAALLEPAGQAVLLPDSPAALAALVALHSGEFEIGESALDRAVATRTGGPLLARRHRLLYAWALMLRGRTAAAAEHLVGVTAGGARLEPRDLLFATGLEVGIARRNSDLAALHRGWSHARDALVRHPVDLFTLLPLGEFAIAAARLGEQARLGTHLEAARLLLERLGDPPLWAAPLHWNGLHAAIVAEQPDVADEHVAALAATAGHTRYGAVVAAAAQSWVEVLRGTVDPVRVEAAARGLHDAGLSWDGARLAGQAAIRTSDRRAMTTLLDCARLLQGRPASHKGAAAGADAPAEQIAEASPTPNEGRLSDRELEVADLVLAGLTYKQIGDRLFISAKTVEHHVARMRQRLGCANRGELLARLRDMAADRAGDRRTRPPWPRRPTE
ncbi:helix-turn-helix transcriptional regulator [Micromonospora pattaloongensis]|uniref:helix-turn-helix transcriptional regulator n=1 Tax=Micromonospora pattaloongensis TaxID=405436 RepID=UPI001C315F12|nr:helix-turn-helix transcriptional regulator [Micromonospora pattaloongensis]